MFCGNWADSARKSKKIVTLYAFLFFVFCIVLIFGFGVLSIEREFLSLIEHLYSELDPNHACMV